ncbi:MAG TPA: hypothetical protein VJU15_13245 [Gemmatimonadales bacterium]|nr:hypothetical protein [Gemmatimonadales bacterium]
MSGEGEFAMWLAIGAGQIAFWMAMTPLIKAFAERISRKGGGPMSDRIEQLEARLVALEGRSPHTGEVELQQERLAELEERLDFTERMLTQQSGAQRGGMQG